MPDYNSVLAVYKSHSDGEAVITALRNSSFDMEKLSVTLMNYQEEGNVLGFHNSNSCGCLSPGSRFRAVGEWLERLLSGLFGIGPAKDHGLKDTTINDYKLVLIAYGTVEEIDRVRNIIDKSSVESFTRNSSLSGVS